MTPMDKYNRLKVIRDMHKNMALVAVTQTFVQFMLDMLSSFRV